MIGTAGGTLFYWYYNTGYNVKYVCDGKDHKFVLAVNTQKTNIYLDGILVASNNSYFKTLPNEKLLFGGNFYGQPGTGMAKGTFHLKYFKLYNRLLNENEFFKYTKDQPLYHYQNILNYIKTSSGLYLKDWSGNGNNLQLINPVNCKSDVIVSNLSLKE